MPDNQPASRGRPGGRYRFGIFEADAATGELRRKGVRIKLHAQPFQLLLMLLEQPGEMLTREAICRELWPGDTFVDFEHGVNSAVNRLREALGDKAASPRYIETLARRGYRFVAPVERIAAEASQRDDSGEGPASAAAAHAAGELRTVPSIADGLPGPPETRPRFLDRVLAAPEDLPRSSHAVVQTLFLLLQAMYLGFYIGALANLAEINGLLSALSLAAPAFTVTIVTAAVLIPVRVFLLCAVLFHAPGLREKFLKLWWFLLPLDLLWSLAPFLLLHHINFGLALACMTVLVYSPFAQRSLVLMGAGSGSGAIATLA